MGEESIIATQIVCFLNSLGYFQKGSNVTGNRFSSTTLRTDTGEEVAIYQGQGKIKHKELGKFPRYLRKNVDP